MAIEAAGGWSTAPRVDAHDPLGRPVRARVARAGGREAAFVEMAQASGLSLRPAGAARRLRRPTSLGTGDVLRTVLDAGIRDIALGIGGSARPPTAARACCARSGRR